MVGNNNALIMNNLREDTQRSAIYSKQRHKDESIRHRAGRECRTKIHEIDVRNHIEHKQRVQNNKEFKGIRDARNNRAVSEASTIRDMNDPYSLDTLATICDIRQKFAHAPPSYINQYVMCWSGQQSNHTPEPDLSIYQVTPQDHYTKIGWKWDSQSLAQANTRLLETQQQHK